MGTMTKTPLLQAIIENSANASNLEWVDAETDVLNISYDDNSSKQANLPQLIIFLYSGVMR